MRLVLPILVATMLLVSASPRAAAPAGSKERLRRLVHLPRLGFVMGLSLDPRRGFALSVDRRAALHEIDGLRKALQGNASDAGRYVRMGQLLEAIGGSHEARQAFAKAVALYRQQGVEQGADGAMLAAWGAALQGLGQLDEAERALRRGVQVAAEQGATHAALARLLIAQALASLAPQSGPAPPDPFAALLSAGGPRPQLAPAQAERARKRTAEALLCYDRAIELAPNEPEPYAGRAAARAYQNVLKWMLDPATSGEPDSLRFAQAMYPAEALSDLRQAMRLAPNDPRALGAAILFELYFTVLERGVSQLGFLGTSEAWENLPEPVRQSVRQGLARLDELSQNADALPAAAALEMLGTLQCSVVNDLPGAERTLRRATALDPKRTQAWETLTFILAATKQSEALLTVCEDRLKVEESARARLLLAKAHELLADWDRVLETTETLQRRYPEDVSANLAFAAALARSSDNEILLTQAAQFLAKAEKLMGTSPPREQVVNLLCLRGLVLGLAGRVEPARHQLKQLQDLDPDHEGLREALEILEQM